MTEIDTTLLRAKDIHRSLQKIVSSNIKIGMVLNDVHQKDLANALGIAQPTLSQKISGRTAWTLEDIEKVSDFFHVKPETLLVAGQGFEPWTSGL